MEGHTTLNQHYVCLKRTHTGLEACTAKHICMQQFYTHAELRLLCKRNTYLSGFLSVPLVDSTVHTKETAGAQSLLKLLNPGRLWVRVRPQTAHWAPVANI